LAYYLLMTDAGLTILLYLYRFTGKKARGFMIYFLKWILIYLKLLILDILFFFYENFYLLNSFYLQLFNYLNKIDNFVLKDSINK